MGQCEDVDQNGILDRAELVACGKATPEPTEEEKKAEEEKKTEEEKKKAEDEKKKTEKTTGGSVTE